MHQTVRYYEERRPFSTPQCAWASTEPMRQTHSNTSIRDEELRITCTIISEFYGIKKYWKNKNMQSTILSDWPTLVPMIDLGPQTWWSDEFEFQIFQNTKSSCQYQTNRYGRSSYRFDTNRAPWIDCLHVPDTLCPPDYYMYCIKTACWDSPYLFSTLLIHHFHANHTVQIDCLHVPPTVRTRFRYMAMKYANKSASCLSETASKIALVCKQSSCIMHHVGRKSHKRRIHAPTLLVHSAR